MPEQTPLNEKFNMSPALAVLLSGVLIAGAIVFIDRYPAQTVKANPEQLPASVNITAPSARDHIIGSLSAPVVLVEYSDFQCPYCKLVYPTLNRIVEESKGGVAWVHRNLPLESIHSEARPAALAAECVAEELGNDAFWKFADAIYNNQGSMSSAYYAQLATQLGANPATFASCTSTEKHAARVDSEALEAQQNGGNGTPFTVVVGGGVQVPVSGALPYAQFMSVINAVKARQ